MNPMLSETMLPPSPFYGQDQGVNIKAFAEALNLDQATVVAASGLSRQLVSQQFNAKKEFIKLRSVKARTFWIKLNQIYQLLLALTDKRNTDKEIRAWFTAPNRALAMERPIDLVRRGELDKIITKLMDILTAAHGG